MPPVAKEMSKAQPMSISQLCQQDDSDDELHNIKQELDRDRTDLNSDEDSDYGSYRGRQNGQDRYSQSSDLDEDEYEDYHRNNASGKTNGHNGTDEPDYAEQLAAEALGDMANARSGSFMTPAVPFISRMSSLPLVNSALKAYESSKQNNKVMKYGAEMVESSVKSLSKPVFEKLEPKLGQLDDFACRQLDKFEKVYPKSEAQPFPSPAESARSSNDMTCPESGSNNYFAHRSRGDSIDSLSSAASSRPSFDVLHSRSTNRQEDSSMRQRSDSQSSQRAPFQFTATQANGYNYSQQQHQQQQLSSATPQQFSGWRGVVATVGSASAAGVAIFSEESMKSLKYCLQWLQYAVQHIDHQIGLLRAFLVSLASPSQNTAIVPSTAASTLASIKKEVVETLRKVINIVSRYAGACLPDHAKISVRQFILSMPVRWATLNNESVPSTPVGSPSLRPVDRSPDDVAALHDTSERATRVLVLANESSDMLRSVASIFKDSVDKAENWMDKLRYVGMNPQTNSEGLPSWAPTGFPSTPGGTMPGGFPGASLEQYSLRQSQPTSNSHATPTGSPTRSLKSSPRLGSRSHKNYNRHAYRQKSVMSGDEDSGSDDDHQRGPMMDDDSSYDDEEDAFTRSASASSSNGHGPMKRSMGSLTHGNDVRRRKKRGESAEAVAGLGLSIANGHSVKEEPM
ncbi:transcriptional repressor OPI1 [Entomortierella parvispora]|uniref:Transcriptional repressor OPI1 n=1 Tax=Entomortierella parvispora TaxID=205924 RepID=A0A9P3HL33_9FUNG|nr:transcriptional repressor OPI1 [Entomortierella parvispora]